MPTSKPSAVNATVAAAARARKSRRHIPILIPIPARIRQLVRQELPRDSGLKTRKSRKTLRAKRRGLNHSGHRKKQTLCEDCATRFLPPFPSPFFQSRNHAGVGVFN